MPLGQYAFKENLIDNIREAFRKKWNIIITHIFQFKYIAGNIYELLYRTKTVNGRFHNSLQHSLKILFIIITGYVVKNGGSLHVG